MRTGSIDRSLRTPTIGCRGIVLGKDPASRWACRSATRFACSRPEGTLTPMGIMPRSRRFRVVGTFSLGLYEFDSEYGFVVTRRLPNA